MPQIIVTADSGEDLTAAPVMLRERVNVSDFESEHFSRHLVERLGWAVEDALELEHQPQGEQTPAYPAQAPERVLTTAS